MVEHSHDLGWSPAPRRVGRDTSLSAHLNEPISEVIFVSKKVLLLLLSLCFSLAFFEFGLRLLLAERLAEVPRNEEDLFWRSHPTLGWERIPHTRGEFTNGLFSGRVSTREFGIRQNGSEWDDGAMTILFIGDSTVASLEVDDHETVPALVERHLRQSGHQANVLNLGVRGYGTDQATAHALRVAELHPPELVIYMYMDNDVFNNNTLKNPNRVFGKPVWVRRADSSFSQQAQPVPDYGYNHAGFILFDDECVPRVVEGRVEDERIARSRFFGGRRWSQIKTHIYFARLFDMLRIKALESGAGGAVGEAIDPDAVVGEGIAAWSPDLETRYYDLGDIRSRCHDYFTDQVRHLLGGLHAIPSLKSIIAVEWPYFAARKYRETHDEAPPSERMLTTLSAEGILSDTILLNTIGEEESVDWASFACPGDGHFCEAGNEWIARHVAERLIASLEREDQEGRRYERRFRNHVRRDRL